MIEIFHVGAFEYHDYGIAKPVMYTEEMLKEIASSTDKINLRMEHDGETIGELSNFVFKDGGLYADVPKGLDISGFGISPTFDITYTENENYLIPVDFKLLDAGLVDNPRTGIFYNSIKPVHGDDNMADEKILESLNKANADLAKLRQENDDLKKKQAELLDTASKLEELQKSADESQTRLEELEKLKAELEPRANKYLEFENKRKEELIKSIAGEDEETRKMLETEPLEKLQFYSEKKIFTSKPRGVGENEAEGLQQGEQLTPEQIEAKNKENSSNTSWDEYTAWKKDNNIW